MRWRLTWWGWRQGPGSAGPVAGRPGLRHGSGSTWRQCTCPARATRASSALESVPAEMLTKSTSHAIIRIRNKLSNQNYVLSFALFGFLIFLFWIHFQACPWTRMTSTAWWCLWGTAASSARCAVTARQWRTISGNTLTPSMFTKNLLIATIVRRNVLPRTHWWLISQDITNKDDRRRSWTYFT